MRATLHSIQNITPTVRTFWFQPERPVHYVAGQFTELHLPHDTVDDRGIRRWFTLSSSPSEPLLGITTKFEPTSGSSFKRELARLQPGAELNLADPMGDFVLPKNPAIPLVFVAAGLGITPVRSMITWLRDTGEQRSVTLLYTVSTAAELAFETLFRSYNLSFTPLIRDQGAARLTATDIQELAGDDALIYISGPEHMVETLYKELKVKGIDPSRLVGDYFPGYTY